MDRLQELLQQGRLLFVPKAHPKYINNKLRVFKPSSTLKAALVLSLLSATYVTASKAQPNEVVIVYPFE